MSVTVKHPWRVVLLNVLQCQSTGYLDFLGIAILLCSAFDLGAPGQVRSLHGHPPAQRPHDVGLERLRDGNSLEYAHLLVQAVLRQ